ncbi:MAG: ferritin-like domain-containing protein [Trueperaceae bacterium]
MTMQAQNQAFKDLYVEQLRDLYSAEDQLVDALPKMAQAAHSSELREGFEMHLEQTRQQRDQVEQLITQMGEKTSGHTCKGMKGIIAEGQETIDNHKKSDPAIADAALIAAAQRVEHYEIAGYGSARSLAEMMGEGEAVQVLDRIAKEEGETDHKLTDLAQNLINPAAMA